MRLTAKGRYAVTAMLDVALHMDQGPVSLSDISKRQDISLSLFAKLRRRELVSSFRGPGGGYSVKRNLEDISVASIVESVDENVDATRCSGRADCQQGETCLTHDLWADLSDEIYKFLSSISLASIIQKRQVQLVVARQDAWERRARLPAQEII